MKALLGAGALMLAGCAGTLSEATRFDVSPPNDLLDRFLAIDERFGLLEDEPVVLETVREIRQTVRTTCPQGADATCSIRAGLEQLPGPVDDAGSRPISNSVSGVLGGRRGSCSALVATILAVVARDEIGATVLREHVVLAALDNSGRMFETLRAGKQLSDWDVAQYEPHPPGGPLLVEPEDYVAFYIDNLAVRFAETGDVARARTAFDDALALAPDVARIRYNYGSFLMQQGEYRTAAIELERSITLGWEFAPTYVNLGVALWRLGRANEAKTALGRAVELDPGNALAVANLEKIRNLAPE